MASVQEPIVPETSRFKGIKHITGETPMLAIRYTFNGRNRAVYAKVEHMNMTGSIKDWMAFQVLRRACNEGRIKPGDAMADATSGNTGISFLAIGRTLGHPGVNFMPNWMNQERINLVRSLGAKIRLAS